MSASTTRGLHRRDEVWDGELHPAPPPHGDRGRLNDYLGLFFLPHWELLGLGRSYPETGVKRPGAGPMVVLGEVVPEDYRTPDRSFLLPARAERFQGGWIVGGPDAIVEIESPGDESRDKLPFYLGVGVREAIFIHRDTRRVEVFRATPHGWVEVEADDQGWTRSEVLSTELRTETPLTPGGPRALHLRRTDEPTRELVIG